MLGSHPNHFWQDRTVDQAIDSYHDQIYSTELIAIFDTRYRQTSIESMDELETTRKYRETLELTIDEYSYHIPFTGYGVQYSVHV